MISDSDLLESWRGGDVAAGEELFERYFQRIVRFFRSKLQSEAEVKDLVQQTFLACLESRDRIREDSAFRSYLFAIAHNLLRSHLHGSYRAARELDFAETSLHDLRPGPVTIASKRREERLLLEALRRIPLEHQVLLELRYWERMKSRDIADVLGVPHATARTRVRRAHVLLKQALTELATSAAELESTISDLENWVDQIQRCMDAPIVDAAEQH